MMILVDDDELLDAALMQEPARLVLADAFAHGDDVARHQFGDGLARVVGEAHVAIGEDADEPGGLAVRPALDDRNARYRAAAHESERVGERGVGEDRDGIDDHPALESFDLAHLLCLILG